MYFTYNLRTLKLKESVEVKKDLCKEVGNQVGLKCSCKWCCIGFYLWGRTAKHKTDSKQLSRIQETGLPLSAFVPSSTLKLEW